ncbi:NAD(P)/FAD-dependent oxidoreductase [Rubrobacter taiwanensis]|jgi:glycine/D-amino acid oxidase-like deaminating enzyme|nr:FAD-dependent oxidoreductase [Rubrobacter taiwanensis]
MKVAVIGAGILGASVAYRLAEGGARVTLVERGEPGGGASAASFAWVNANEKKPRAYFGLNYAGLREHYRLREEFGGAPWLHPGGNLVWSADARGLRERVERLRGWGYAAETVGEERARELEPEVRSPGVAAAYFPEEAWVDVPRLVRELVERARAAGAEVRTGSPVVGIEAEVSAVRLAGGERVAVDAVVNAAGPDADRVAGMAGSPLPLAPRRGLLVRLEVRGAPLRRVLHAPEVNLRPDGAGYLIAHHESVDRRLGGKDERRLAVELLERARGILPVPEARVSGVRVGTRPVPADGYPSVGAAPGIPGYYEAVTHSGVTLGPLLGRLLACEILGGEVHPLAAPYRPGRLREQRMTEHPIRNAKEGG